MDHDQFSCSMHVYPRPGAQIVLKGLADLMTHDDPLAMSGEQSSFAVG